MKFTTSIVSVLMMLMNYSNAEFQSNAMAESNGETTTGKCILIMKEEKHRRHLQVSQGGGAFTEAQANNLVANAVSEVGGSAYVQSHLSNINGAIIENCDDKVGEKLSQLQGVQHVSADTEIKLD